MAVYHLNVSVVSRGKGQNVVAKAAYNSASKIKDFKEEKEKDYTKKQCDYSEILLPKNAPDELKDREYLWNKVNSIEKRKDSRLAREIKIALPNELDKEDNLSLTLDFAETLVDEGMIVDINIHEIESNNPHAHLLCTMRGIDENGEFEPKRIGDKRIRDWDNNDKIHEWRKRWSDIQNKHLEKHGIIEKVSEKSYKDQGINLEPTLKEGWKSRKYYKETGKKSEVAKYNQDIKRRNKEKINNFKVNNNINKLNPYDYINKEKSKELSNISKELKVYLSPKSLMEKSIYIDDLSSKSLLISNKEKQNIQIEKAKTESDLVDKAKEIFTAQAHHFFKENYSNLEMDLADDDKIYLTHYMLENNIVLNPNKFPEVINNKIEEEQLESLNNILSNKDISHENIEREKGFFMDKLESVLNENNINLNNIEEYDESYYKGNDFNKVLYYTSKLEKLALADNILEQYYDNKISNLFGDNQEEVEIFKEITNTEEKKDIVDFIDFYGEDKTLYIIETGKYNMRFNEDERKEIIDSSMLITEKLNSKFPTDRDNYIVNKTKNDIQEKYNIDITNSNDIKFIFKESLLNEDDNIHNKINDFEVKADKYNYQYKPTNFSEIHKGINSLVYSMNEIFKERMTKYQNKQYKSKNHSQDKMQPRSKRRSRGQGLT